MATPPLPDDHLRRIVEAIEEALRAGHPKRRAGDRLSAINVASQALVKAGAVGQQQDVYHALRVAKRRMGLEPDWSLEQKPEAVEVGQAPERTLEEEVDLHRARKAASHAAVQLKEARAEIARLQDRIRDLEWCSTASLKPADWTLKISAGRQREHLPYLLTSDQQLGEVIRAEETDAAHGYDVETFKRRFRRLITATIDICLNHKGEWTFPGVIYARGGDTISGGIHEELAETDELTPLEAVELAFEEEAAAIHHLRDAMGRVEVKQSRVGGNHDRTTPKSRTKRAAGHSYDRLVCFMLEREFRNDPGVTFQTSESPDVYFRVYGQRVLLTHGDRIGSRGGEGFVGPAATIARGAQKVIAEQARLGRMVDEVHLGHFHTALDLGFCLANGCFPGYSEYAKLNRLRPEAPSQWLSFYHPRYGAVSRNKIWLEEPLQRELADAPAFAA